MNSQFSILNSQFSILIRGHPIVHRRSFRRSRHTGRDGIEEALKDGLVGLAIVLTEEGLDRFGGLLEMVVRHRQENVMGNVSANVVMNPVDKSIVTIDRRKRTLQEIPILPAIPRNIGFGMMQIRH